MPANQLALTVLTLLLFSCRTTSFKGGLATKEAPVTELPVATETVILKAPRVLTLSVSQLKHDALNKNCLSVTVDGQRHQIACNKDFSAVPPQVITLRGEDVCHPIRIAVDSFKPLDEADCIRRIQANREQHSCAYQSDAFRTALVPDAERFKASILSGKSDRIEELQLAFEDNQDADFNDYVFWIKAGDGTYLQQNAEGVSSCLGTAP